MRRSFLILMVMLLLPVLCYSQVEQVGIMPDPLGGRMEKYAGIGSRSGEFLTIPADARGVALGEAAIAGVDDISAVYWNPANLGFIASPQVMFTNVNYMLDFSYNFVAGVIPFKDGQGVCGAFTGILTVDPEEITSLMEPDGTGRFFDSYSMVSGGTLAYNISDRFSAGINVKWVHEDIWDITANAFAMDIGSNYHTDFLGNPIRIAFVVTNLGTNLRFTGDKLSNEILPRDELGRNKYVGTPRTERADRFGYRKTNAFNLPSAFKIGVHYQPYQDEHNRISVAAEYQEPNYLQTTFNVGFEYIRSMGGDNTIAGRIGYKYMRDEIDLEGADRLRGLAVGGGINHDFWDVNARFDYAYSDNGFLGGLHYITMTMTF